MLGPLVIAIAQMYAGLMPPSPDIVTIHVGENIVYTGERNRVEIEVVVKEGYHVQANEVNDESLIPTTLEIKSNEYLTIRKKEFPLSKKFKLEGTDNFLDVYDGKFMIKLFIDLPRTAAENKYLLDAKLRYQACDSKSCFFPRTVDFLIPVEVKSKK